MIAQPDDSRLYEKCAGCHLFVEPIGSLAPNASSYEHLDRGDEADEALIITHDPAPSGMKATLATWREFGPREMRRRFDPTKDGTRLYRVEVQRMVVATVDVEATDPFDATVVVDRLDFPLPPLDSGAWSHLKGDTYVVCEGEVEVYRQD